MNSKKIWQRMPEACVLLLWDIKRESCCGWCHVVVKEVEEDEVKVKYDWTFIW